MERLTSVTPFAIACAAYAVSSTQHEKTGMEHLRAATPFVLGALAAYVTYGACKLIIFPKKIPGAYYPPLPDPSKVPGGKIMVSLFGHLSDEMAYEAKGEAGVGYLSWITSATNQHQPMTMFMGMGMQKLHPSHPKDVEYILFENSQNYPKDPSMYGKFARAFGDGLFTQVDEAAYPMHRSEVSKAFAPRNLKRIANESVNAHLGGLLADLGKAADSSDKLVVMNEEMLRLGMNITTQAALRIEEQDKLDTIWELYHEMMKYLWNPLRFTDFGDKYLLWWYNRKLNQVMKKLHAIADEIVTSLQKLPPPGEGEGKALIDYLAHSEKLPRQMILDDVLTFLFAGSDTTSTTMFFAFYHLAKYPAEQEKLFEELSAALGSGQRPVLDDISGCEFLQKVVKETLRLRSPAPGVIKTCLKDDVLPGSKQFVPKGQLVNHVLFCEGRMQDLYGFDDMNTFRPGRWDDEGLPDRLGRVGYIPFGAGLRSCPGRDFALNEAHLVIATVIRNFKLSWPEGEPEPWTTIAPAYHCNKPSRLKVQRRTD